MSEKKPAVLVIDDDEAIRDSCSQVLQKSGFAVTLSSDGNEGLEKTMAMKPDLVLLDLKMPGIGGMEVLEKMLQLDDQIVVIVITGYPTIESAVEAIKKGAYDFLPKPFTGEELRVVVRRGIERRNLVIESNQLRREKERLEKNFISMVSHQLRSPLANVQQYFEVILQGFAGDMTPKQREILEKQQRNVTELLKLIEDWLSMARIDREVVQKRLQSVSPAELFEGIREALEPMAAKDNVQLKFASLKALPCASAVPELMKEAFSNLIHNAVKYNRPGGEVSVTGRAGDDFVEIEIADTGIGIEEAALPRIFDEFFRPQEAPGEKTGFGLGLAITRKIIDAHSGSIHASSTPGRGTTFTVLLPKA